MATSLRLLFSGGFSLTSQFRSIWENENTQTLFLYKAESSKKKVCEFISSSAPFSDLSQLLSIGPESHDVAPPVRIDRSHEETSVFEERLKGERGREGGVERRICGIERFRSVAALFAGTRGWI